MIDRHHLLECIIWPNGDGTFRKIVNTMKRLDELGIYDDYKLTIPIEHSAHMTMHAEFKKGTEYELIGDKAPMYGRTGERAPMHGRTGDKHHNWKGDKAGPGGKYNRYRKLYNIGEITEEEFQPFRDAWAEYQLKRKEMKRNASSL